MTGGAAVGVGLAAVRPATAQTTITLKMQSTWPTKDIFHEVFVDWGKKAEEMAGGRLKIDILPAGAVVPAFQLIEAVHQGTLMVGTVCRPTGLASTWRPACLVLARRSGWMRKAPRLDILRWWAGTLQRTHSDGLETRGGVIFSWPYAHPATGLVQESGAETR